MRERRNRGREDVERKGKEGGRESMHKRKQGRRDTQEDGKKGRKKRTG